jgi:hypothetical protein
MTASRIPPEPASLTSPIEHVDDRWRIVAMQIGSGG